MKANTIPNACQVAAAAIDLCLKFDIQPDHIEAQKGNARIVVSVKTLTGEQRRNLKRHFGKLTKSNYSGDLFSDEPVDFISLTIRGAYECRTVCVAVKDETSDFELEAETISHN